MNKNTITKKWYEKSYATGGFAAQRRYPNEELCRFMGRNYFSIQPQNRKETRILEVGCGSGGNLWMIAKEGFDAYGQDLSEESIGLCEQMLDWHGVSATLGVGDMCCLDYQDDFFDAVVDVFSSYCLSQSDGNIFLTEVFNKLKPGGRFFSYFPSKASDAFIDFEPSKKIDCDTLNGIYRESSPYYGNFYPFRFFELKQYADVLAQHKFQIVYIESVVRSYSFGGENFEFVVVDARKPQNTDQKMCIS